MINKEQIRAARALLDWSQKDLSLRADVSVNALNSIERGNANPRAETLKAIRDSLEGAGIEFLEGTGVRFRGESFSMQVFDGPDMMERYYLEFLSAFLEGPAEVLTNGIDNARFGEYYPKRLAAYRKFEVEAKKRDITERCLVQEGKTNLMSRTNIFRWAPEELFGKIPYAIYGDNVGIFLWGPPMRLVVIRNQSIAETFRQQFEMIWKIATPVPDRIWEIHRHKDKT